MLGKPHHIHITLNRPSLNANAFRRYIAFAYRRAGISSRKKLDDPSVVEKSAYSELAGSPRAPISQVRLSVLLACAGFGLMSLPYGFLADRWGEPETLLLMGLVVLGLCGVFSVLLSRRRKVFADSQT